MPDLLNILRHGPWPDRLLALGFFLLLLGGWSALAALAWWLDGPK